MRKFLRLIVILFVIGLISYTVCFLIQSTNEYQVIRESGEEFNNNPIVDYNGDQQEGEHDKNSGNQDELPLENINSGENKEENLISSEISGDNLEEKITSINMIETKNRLANLKKSLDDNVGVEIVGLKNQEFIDEFELTEMAVTVQVAGTMIYIIPASDFVDNAQYHYDENGNLVLYICELTGIGGNIRYYFENGSCIKQEQNIEENIEISYESIEEILDRASLIYQRYMK